MQGLLSLLIKFLQLYLHYLFICTCVLSLLLKRTAQVAILILQLLILTLQFLHLKDFLLQLFLQFDFQLLQYNVFHFLLLLVCPT